MILDLATALAMIGAAEDRARRRGLAVCVAVVDGGGSLVALHRMDGACIATADLARDKAYSALALKEATHEILARCQPGMPLFGLHHSCGGRLVLLGGGLPVYSNGDVIGGVGVSGAPDEDDIACARAAVAAFGAA
ncbi:MAG: heme-binding protein [Acidimicrobiia bacterium]|nr:heme-binding protein [Acidimicrobiia bacterium]